MHDSVRILKAARINAAAIVTSSIIEGMKADNLKAQHEGKPPVFGSEDFIGATGNLEYQADRILMSENDY